MAGDGEKDLPSIFVADEPAPVESPPQPPADTKGEVATSEKAEGAKDGGGPEAAKEEDAKPAEDENKEKEPATGRLWLNWDSLERRVKRGKWIVVSASRDHSLKVWDLSSRECRGTLSGKYPELVHEGAVRCVSMDLETRVCMSGSADGTVGLWNMEECECNDSYLSAKLGSQLCLHVDWRPEVRRAITGTGTGNLCIWDAKNCSNQGTWAAHPGVRVTVVAAQFEVPADAKLTAGIAVSGGQDGKLKRWDIRTSACTGTFSDHAGEAISCLAVNFELNRAISGAQDGSLFLVDLDSGTFQETCNAVGRLEGHSDRVTAVKVDWDNMQAVTGSEDDSLRVWDLEDLSCLGTLTGHLRGVRDISVDFEESYALSASDDNTLRLWDIQKMKCDGILKGHTDRVLCCRLRLERDLACSASQDGTIKVWDLEQMKEEDTFYGHASGVIAIAG